MEKLLPKNEHPVERGVRVVAGITMIGAGAVWMSSSWLGAGLLGLGLVPLATGLLGSCPLYTLFGVSTCSVR